VKLVKCGVAFGLKRLGLLVACAGILVSLTVPSSAEDRTISIFNIHTKDTITVTFKRNGKYVPEALQQLNHFMRDWRRDLETKMDPALIDLVWELHEELGSKEPVHLICGYRSPGTNEMLRRTVGGQARNSRHITGQAADLMFPDVPLKQLRYSALIRERGGVGYYPASGLPFVHVDTGNVRHWPRIARMELAALFPGGRSLHVPADGRPITAADHRMALASLKASGGELPWALTHKQAGPMLASLTPSSEPPVLQQASLTLPNAAPAQPAGKPAPAAKLGSAARERDEPKEPQLAEEGEEQEDDFVFEPVPAAFLLTEQLLSAIDILEGRAREPVLTKIGLLMASPSTLASEDFDHRLQIEALYEANTFRGPAIAFMERQKARMAAASQTAVKEAMR
jgi:uncharacterized protein YcbK (DUF882 family)